MNAVSMQTKEGNYVFPLYLYKDNNGTIIKTANLNLEIVKKIAHNLNYDYCLDDKNRGDLTEGFDDSVYPQDIFDYIYAILHSPSYRERYKEFLKIDFPRIPYPSDKEKFRSLVDKGAELRKLHLMDGIPNQTGVSFPMSGSLIVKCISWENNRVYINNEQYFNNVPKCAWELFIGGYQPAQKWLKDRVDKVLSFEDVKHYSRIIYVLQQTEKLMKEIDEVEF